MAGSSKASQASPVIPHAAESGLTPASRSHAVPKEKWVELIHRAWADFIPIIIANAKEANVLIARLKGFDPSRKDWQIDTPRSMNFVNEAIRPNTKGYWTRNIMQDYDLGAIAPAFSQLHVPGSQRAVSFSTAGNIKVVRWKQDGPFLTSRFTRTHIVSKTKPWTIVPVCPTSDAR